MRIALWLLLAVSPGLFGQSRGRPADYALILNDQPVLRVARSRAALDGPQARAQMSRIRAAQEGVTAELRRRKVAVQWAGQLLVNAIVVSATRETASALRGIAGVAHVVAARPLRMDLNRALDLANVTAAYSAVGGAGNAGAGIRIGIIDSGIDQNHPGFQDPSLRPPAWFPMCTDGHPEDCAFTSNKVIVVRSYIAQDAAPYDPEDPLATSWPDDLSPRDHQGHGTAIAMIAAGVAHDSPIGRIQGVAPKAFLGNYKVIGSPGVNDFARFAAVQQALQDAVTDKMDVVTLSLSEGDPAFFGPLDVDNEACGGVCDLYVQAVESAVAAGVVVVVSAGNDGNVTGKGQTLTTIHTPGTAPSAITVGATMNAHVLYQTARVNGTGAPAGLQNIRGLFGDGPHPVSAVTAEVRVAGLACSELGAGSMADAIALVERGTCTFSDKINNAQRAGAKAVLLYLAAGQEAPFTALGAVDTGIPAMVIGNADGVALQAYAAANAGATVTLDPAFRAEDSTANTVWPNSSRGPSAGNFGVTPTRVIKPELVAPGVGIYTAAQKYDASGDAFNATGYTGVSGTSYAVPMVAGAVAIVKQKFGPSLTPAQLKSIVVNTASPDVLDQGTTARINAAGAGKLNVGDAVRAGAALVPDTISFGQLTAATESIGRQLTITNLSGASATFNIAVQQLVADNASSVRLSASSLTLAAGQSNDITVTLQGNRPAPGSYEGVLVVTGGGGPALRVPYQYLVGSGTAVDLMPLCCGSFVTNTNFQDWELDTRTIDQYGVPVLNAPVLFEITKGGGKVSIADATTARLGNAAALVNFDGTPGEQVVTARVGSLSYPFNGLTLPFPAISDGGVVNAASGQLGQGLAPGSYISIFGSGFADATQATSTLNLPVSLSTVSVSFFGNGMNLPGHLHFVSPTQVNVQIPWEYQGQSQVTMKVNFGFLQSNLYQLKLAAYSPGVFLVGGGPAVLDADFKLVNAANPAKRGKVIQIFVNGLGPVANQPVSGSPSGAQPLSDTVVKPTVSIGGVNAEVGFSGLAPGIVGLYQVNATVPANAPTGPQALVVSIGGVQSNSSNLTVQ